MSFKIKDGYLLEKYTGRDTVVSIPDGVTKIGYKAFDGCISLSQVNIPDGVTEIGDYAFSGCSSLSQITIPDGVTKIGRDAFAGCRSLSQVNIPDSVTEIGEWAFARCRSLSQVNIPDSVTKIGGDAFCGCSSLSQVNIPDGVTEIDWSAFAGCSSLSQVNIPDSVTEIGRYAFYGCSSLSQITIPNSVTEIGYKAFYECSSLSQITIPNSVTEIGEEAFDGCSSLSQITIPNCVTEIVERAFARCSSLSQITIPNGVTKIGRSAFYGCSSLSQVTIPDGVTEIGDHAFDGCSALSQITIPDGVTEIGNEAFAGCSSLSQVTIPDGVTEIGDHAFDGCSALSQVNIPDGVTEIGEGAFKGCKNLADKNGFFILNGILNSYSGSDTRVTIPDGVTEIGWKAFEGCSSLTRLILPDNATRIDSSAFQGCTKLRAVTSASGEIRWRCSLPHTIIPYIKCKDEVDCAYLELFQNGKKLDEYLDKQRFDREKVLEEIVRILLAEEKISSAHTKKVHKYIEKYKFELSDTAVKNALDALNVKKPAAKTKKIATKEKLPVPVIDFSKELQTKHRYGWSETESAEKTEETTYVSQTERMTGFRNAVFRGFKTDIDKVIVFADAEGFKLTAAPTDIDDISDVYVDCTRFWSSDRNFIDKVIYNFPEIKVIAFFEDWETYDVYACLSSSGNSYVDTEMRVGLIDSNSDPTYSEEQFPTESFSLTAEMHNSDHTERVRYNFPYKNRWNDLDYAHIEDNKLYRISSIDIAEGTETIDRYDFSYNVHLKRLSLPSTLKTLSGNALAKKSDIEIVIHPDNPYLNFDGQFLTEKQKGEVLFISENADLAALANPSINAIASNAFCNIVLESITIPANITTIHDYAFENQTKLRTVVFEGSELPKVSHLAFAACKNIGAIIFPNAPIEQLQLTGFEKPVVTGFLGMVTTGKYSPSKEVLQGGNAYIKKHNQVIVNTFADNLKYISYCLENELLSAQSADQLLKHSNNKTELRNMLQNHAASFDTQNTGNEIVSEGTEDPQAPISLYELKFVVTGDLKSYPDRADFKAYIESRGGKLISAVSSKTDYLITNTPNSGTVKNVKARSLGIPVITEDEFFEKFGK